MIRVIVFSRDRALQLEAVLRSFRLQTSGSDSARIAILYRATTLRHRSQYERLSQTSLSAVRFVPEQDFEGQLKELIVHSSAGGAPGGTHSVGRSPGDYLLFLVDDTVFVRPVDLAHVTESLVRHKDAMGFSLRLGRNTTYCYSAGRPQSLPKFENIGGSVLKFRWLKADGDFGYPLELSSSLYRCSDLVPFIRRLRFEGPSSLESQMSIHSRELAHAHAALLCFEQSAAFSIPLNRVQDVFENRAGYSERFSAESLADVFETGRVINVDALAGFTPNACHQEVELQFE